ncbi:RNA editing [Perkinsela sp. CCAP 1560/4]|nr:RNA editing [Perkinsela sp. CCAP 1560/4]|eukprot:KNH05615.1 RNA editing [Perkinsela sp. CCAP 1560/4]
MGAMLYRDQACEKHGFVHSLFLCLRRHGAVSASQRSWFSDFEALRFFPSLFFTCIEKLSIKGFSLLHLCKMGKRYETIIRYQWNGRFTQHVNHNTVPNPPKSMTIPATAVHNNPRHFWTERLGWNRTRSVGPILPTWDRLANLAIMLSRPVEPSADAGDVFRKLFDTWKNFFLTKITMTRAAILPQLTMSTLGNIQRKDGKKE